MRALTVEPGVSGSLQIEHMAGPTGDGGLLVQGLLVGICGTDVEIASGLYGTAPDARQRLIIGHESLGRVIEAPADSGFAAGDLVVGIVRRPDPVPCPQCAAGEWDMCSNGRYTEHGIKGAHGFAAELWRHEVRFCVLVDASLGALGVLLEPASVVAKAWEQIERIGHRTEWRPQTVLVTGAGPVGLLAALLGAQRGLEVHMFDRVTEGPRPALARDLGATWHGGPIDALDLRPDIVVECTGAASLVFDLLGRTGRNGIVCLTGLSSDRREILVQAATLNRTMVLENDVVFGSVNANRRHYALAARALAAADPQWLARLITRRVALSNWQQAFEKGPDDIKVVLDLTA